MLNKKDFVFFMFARPAKKKKAEARADSSPDPSSARARPFKDRTVFFEPRGAWKMLADTGFGRGNTKQSALRADRIVAPKTRLELMRKGRDLNPR